MLTLDERLRRILAVLAKEPSKAKLWMGGEEGWVAGPEDECALCGGEETHRRQLGDPQFKHKEDCAVREARAILRDHP